MSLRSKFAMSPDLEQKGVQYEIDTARITIARAGGSNTRYIAAIEKVYREHGRAIQNDLIGNDKALAVIRQVYVDTIILDWETMVEPAALGVEAVWKRGIEDYRPDAAADAPLLPFTPEHVDGVLRAYPDLFMEIRAIADNASLYRRAILEGVAKN